MDFVVPKFTCTYARVKISAFLLVYFTIPLFALTSPIQPKFWRRHHAPAHTNSSRSTRSTYASNSYMQLVAWSNKRYHFSRSQMRSSRHQTRPPQQLHLPVNFGGGGGGGGAHRLTCASSQMTPSVHLQDIQSWALSVFLNFFNNKKWFFCSFKNHINNLFLHQSYLKSPLPVKLTFFIIEKN